MKDPLHKESIPYEILGVSPGAQRLEVENAFARALRNGTPPNVAKNARDILIRPEKKIERVFLEVLQYNQEHLEKLYPNQIEENIILDPKNRLETAKRWEEQLKTGFPDVGTAHCLAVLWYWWTVYEEDRQGKMLESLSLPALESIQSKEKEKPGWLQQKANILREVRREEGVFNCEPCEKKCELSDCNWESDCRSSAPPLEDMWRRKIAYWSMIAADPEIWSGFFGLSMPDASEMRKKIISDLRNHLIDRRQQYTKKLRFENTLATRYRHLEVVLNSEMKTAKEVAGSGYKTKKGRLCAGVQMMHFMGLLEKMRLNVDKQLEKSPNNNTYKRLQYVLSEYFEIEELLKDVPPRPEEALQSIQALPEQKRKLKKVKHLQGYAYMLKGRQNSEAGDVDKAFENWRKALESGMEKEVQKELESDLAGFCYSKAMKLRDKNVEEAIDILEKGLVLVKHEKLELALGDLLVDKAIRNVNNANNDKVEKTQLILVLEKAKADLERAAELGSRRAIQNLETVKKDLEILKALSILDEAYAAAKRMDLNTAINKLREAKRRNLPDLSVRINKDLAACLVRRADETVRSWMDPYIQNKPSLQPAEEDLLEAQELDPGHPHLDKLLQMIRILLGRTPLEETPWKKPPPRRDLPFFNTLSKVAFLSPVFWGLFVLLALFLLFNLERIL